jgi:hypothetical protein
VSEPDTSLTRLLTLEADGAHATRITDPGQVRRVAVAELASSPTAVEHIVLDNSQRVAERVLWELPRVSEAVSEGDTPNPQTVYRLVGLLNGAANARHGDARYRCAALYAKWLADDAKDSFFASRGVASEGPGLLSLAETYLEGGAGLDAVVLYEAWLLAHRSAPRPDDEQARAKELGCSMLWSLESEEKAIVAGWLLRVWPDDAELVALATEALERTNRR